MLGAVWRIYRVPVLFGVFSFIFIALSVIIFLKSYQAQEPILFSSPSNEAGVAGEVPASAIVVDVEGAVVVPGVYRMPAGSRVEDAIAKAGGLNTHADEAAIAKTMNRAAKLTDGAKIYIPVQGENLHVEPRDGPKLININTATQTELDALSGVGSATVSKIIAGRPYLRIGELVEKKVMSQSVFTKLKDQLTL